MVARRLRYGIGVLLLLASSIVFGTPEIALAASGHVVLAAATSLSSVIDNIRNWLVGLLAGLATLFLTIGGVRYLVAGGDPSEVERAKQALRYAAVGYGVAVLAPLLVTILKGFVGA
jgi:hypothetical protein